MTILVMGLGVSLRDRTLLPRVPRGSPSRHRRLGQVVATPSVNGLPSSIPLSKFLPARATDQLERASRWIFSNVNYLTPLDQPLNYSAEGGRMGRPYEKCRFGAHLGNVGHATRAPHQAHNGRRRSGRLLVTPPHHPSDGPRLSNFLRSTSPQAGTGPRGELK